MLNKRHNLKSGKAKTRKRDLQEENKTGNKKKIDEEHFVFESLDVVPFMKQKQRRKKMKERDKKKEPKKSKKKDKKKERRKEQERERERKRKRN